MIFYQLLYFSVIILVVTKNRRTCITNNGILNGKNYITKIVCIADAQFSVQREGMGYTK